MFLHFSRWGLLVPPILIISCVGGVVAFDLTIGREIAKAYRWPNCLIFFLSGTACWLLRNTFRTENKEITVSQKRQWKWVYQRTNTFLFLSFRAWAFVFYALTLFHLLRPLK